MSASYEVRGGIAVITLNNPPVNGLGYETRKSVAEGVEKAEGDAAVKAIVITGAGKAFSGGADIREFGSPKALAEPNLLSLIARVEGSSKPARSTPPPCSRSRRSRRKRMTCRKSARRTSTWPRTRCSASTAMLRP